MALAFKRMWIVPVLTMFYGCAAMPGKDRGISVLELMAHQEAYDGKSVRISGYASWGFENCVLIPADPQKSKEAFKYSIWYSLFEVGCATGKYARDVKYG